MIKQKNKYLFILSQTLNCPTTGSNRTISKFKYSINCPKYIEICNAENNKLCNDMFV